jgi:hypothetical protein
MCSKFVPNENQVEVTAWDIVHLNITANIIKNCKNIGGGTNRMYTFDPAPRTLKTPWNMWWQGRISRLDSEDDSHLCAVLMIIPILLDAHHLHSPPPCAVTLLK